MANNLLKNFFTPVTTDILFIGQRDGSLYAPRSRIRFYEELAEQARAPCQNLDFGEAPPAPVGFESSSSAGSDGWHQKGKSNGLGMALEMALAVHV